MSETSEAVAGPQLPPGVTVTKKIQSVNHQPEEYHTIAFGDPLRTVIVVDLDMGAQFDLAEVTGSVAGDNMEYRNLAFIAASVRQIDDFIPSTYTGLTKPRLREVLKRLGADGVRAAGAVIAGFAAGPSGQPATETEHRAAVGN